MAANEAGAGGGQNPGRADWRGRSGGVRPAASAGSRSWGADHGAKPVDEQARRVLRYRFKLALWSLVTLGLIAAVVVIVFFFPKKTPFIAMALTDYDPPLPPNAWAQEDLDGFARLNQKNLAYLDITSDWTSRERGLRALRERLAAAVPGGPGRNVVMVYLSLHGLVDPQGEPGFVLSGGSGYDPSTWLPVSDVLQQIRELQLPPHVHLLLALDASRTETVWSEGVLYNGFADRLQQALEKAALPNVVLLNSTGRGQVGWSSPEMQGSVFGFFLRLGLTGAADLEEAGDRNGRVSLRELVAYLKKRVNQWTWSNRLDAQEPMLLAGTSPPADFDLVWTESDALTQAAAEMAANSSPPGAPSQPGSSQAGSSQSGSSQSGSSRSAATPGDSGSATRKGTDYGLRDLWNQHARLLEVDTHPGEDPLRQGTSHPLRRDPVAWHLFQNQLVYLEQLSTAGKAYASAAANLQAKLEPLPERLSRRPVLDGITWHGLTLARELGPASTVAAADLEKARQHLLNPAQFPPPPVRFNYQTRSAVGWSVLQKQASRDQLKRVLDYVGQPERDSDVGLIEIHFARMLEKYVDPKTWDSASEDVLRLIQLRELAELASTPADERCLPWLRGLLTEGDRLRRQAEDLLLVGDVLSLDQSRVAASRATEQYQQARRLGRDITSVWYTRDRLLAELPHLARWLARRRIDDKDRLPLDTALADLLQLQSELAPLHQSLEWGASWQELEPIHKRLAGQLDAFRKLYDDQCYKLRFEAAEVQTKLRDIEGVLSIPLVTGSLRNELRDASARIAREKYADSIRLVQQGRLEGATGQPLDPATASSPDTPPSSTVADGDIPPWLKRITSWPAHPQVRWVEMLSAHHRHPSTLRTPHTEKGALGAGAGAIVAGSDPPTHRAAPDEPSSPRTPRDTSSAIALISQQGQQVRTGLAQLPGELSRDITAAWKKLAAAGQTPFTCRGDLLQAEFRQRAAAWSIVTPSTLTPSTLTPSTLTPSSTTPSSTTPASAALAPGEATEGAVAELTRLDRHQLLVWHAERTLEDFWGPARPGAIPFFAPGAQDILAGAEMVCKPASGLRSQPASQLAARRTLAEKGLPVQARPETQFVFDAGQSLQQTLLAQPPAAFPAGLAAVSLRTSTGETVALALKYVEKPVPASRLGWWLGRDDAITASLPATSPVAIAPNEPTRPESTRTGASTRSSADGGEAPITPSAREARLELVFSADQAARQTAPLQVLTAYRGHEYPLAVNVVQSREGVIVHWDRPKPVPTRVTVAGQVQQRTAISLVFDCSGSMSNRVKAKVDNAEFDRPRLDIARDAFRQILQQLARAKTYNVAVRIYGHRAGWKDAQGTATIFSPLGDKAQKAAVEAGRKFELHPGDDVEQILEMGQFGNRELQTVTDLLADLKPWGETPLYLAVSQAAQQDFVDQTAAGSRHIIVITDGVNEQSPGCKFPRSLTDVQAVLKNRDNIRLDIVGFDLTSGGAAQLQDLKDLAAQTGGSFSPARNPAQLLDVLEKSLGLSKYVVTDMQGQPVDTPRELGSTLELERIPRGAAVKYTAKLVGLDPVVRSDEFWLEGGESLELFLSADKRRLEHRRYTGSVEQGFRDQQESLVDPLKPDRKVFVGAHLPEWTGSAVRFPLSVQNADEHKFSPRPAETWVEIKPVSVQMPGRKFPVYVFYDSYLEPGRPVPVFSFFAQRWPAQAERAEIQFWGKFSVTEPDETHLLADLARQAEARGDGTGDAAAAGALISPKAHPEISLRVQWKRGRSAEEPELVSIAEQHPVGTTDFAKLRLELSPFPSRVSRTLHPEGGLILHTFTYSPDERGLLREARLRLTSKSRITTQAVTLQQPLTVTVPAR